MTIEQLHERLRRPPSPSSVSGSLPVLSFGDLRTARVATIGLNPSKREYLDSDGRELDGPERRFETLRSLGTLDRASLSDYRCDVAIERMQRYFGPGKPVYAWFRAPDRILTSMGVSYQAGDAVHLDLVQEATDPTWSAFTRRNPLEAQRLRATDEPFLRWQLETCPLCVVICNGRTMYEAVHRLLGSKEAMRGRLQRVTWRVGVGSIGGREVGLAGWNLSLAHAGLRIEEQQHLGTILAANLREVGIQW